MGKNLTVIRVLRHTLQFTFDAVPKTNSSYKKVLLRERKRHTARHVASTPYDVLTGYPPRAGYPPSREPPCQGTPPRQGTPWLDLARYPPHRCLPHGILGNVCKALWDMGTPPCGQTDWWMDRHVSKHYLPVVLRTRAVKIAALTFEIPQNVLLKKFFFTCQQVDDGNFQHEILHN